MAYTQFTQYKSTFEKAKNEGSLVYIGGKRIRLIGFPVNADGSVSLKGKTLTFKGMLPNSDQFQVLDYDGTPLRFTIPSAGFSKIPNFIHPSPVMLPVKNPELFEGVSAIIPMVDSVQVENIQIEIHTDPIT